MGRPRAFDPDQVVDQVMRLFWRKGYVATSMADIYAATGLKPGSLYGAFGDKEALFRRAFDRYAAHFHASMPDGAHGMAAIEAWIATQARLAGEDPERAGCLIINTLLERAEHAPETQAMADSRLEEIRQFFVTHLGEAVAAGDVDAARDKAATADALVGAVVAIMALGRAGVPQATIDHVAAAALQSIKSDRSIKNVID